VECAGATTVLSFLPLEEEERVLSSMVDFNHDHSEIIRAESELDAAVLRAREKYTAFNAQWPGTAFGGQGNFKERFTYRGTLSLWWLAGASMKQNETSDTFDYLCHMEVFSKVLGDGKFQKCTVVTGDPMFSFLLRGCCQSQDVVFNGNSSNPGLQLPSIMRAAFRRTGFLFWQLGIAALLWLLFRGRSKLLRSTGKYLGLLTTYPEILDSQDGRPLDRVYRSLPQALGSKGVRTSLIASIYGPPSAILGRIGELWRLRRSSDPDFLPLQSLGRPSDLLVSWGQWATFWRYIRTEPQVRSLLKYDGVDISPLVLRDLRKTFLGNEIVYNLSVLRLLERWARDTVPNGLLCSLELYSFARAAYFGVKIGSPGSWTISLQHANISTAKMWYSYLPGELAASGNDHVAAMPLPDRYIFQGDGGHQLVTKSGYPSVRGVVLGSPRYDNLRESPEGSVKNVTGSSSLQVLVVPSLSRSDTGDLIRAVAAACLDPSSTGTYEILVKPHPACPVDEFLDHVRSRHKNLDIKIVTDDLHQLIEQSDLVVTSYSTAGDEAIAMGRPVIAYTGLRPSMSTYLDVLAAPLVHSAEELREAMTRMLTDQEYRDQFLQFRSDLTKWTFHLLDGGSTGRIADYIDQLLISSPEPE